MEWKYEVENEYTITRSEMLKRLIINEIEKTDHKFWEQILEKVLNNALKGDFKTRFETKELTGFKEYIVEFYNKDKESALYTILKDHFVNIIRGLGYEISVESKLLNIPGFHKESDCSDSIDEIDNIKFEIKLI